MTDTDTTNWNANVIWDRVTGKMSVPKYPFVRTFDSPYYQWNGCYVVTVPRSSGETDEDVIARAKAKFADAGMMEVGDDSE